jgi:hypothetical protein
MSAPAAKQQTITTQANHLLMRKRHLAEGRPHRAREIAHAVPIHMIIIKKRFSLSFIEPLEKV